MATRGRTSGGKRPVLPNLALAGKREEKSNTPTQPKKRRSDRGDRRGGRGRGRGGHGGKDRPALIESAGIFSEGLSGADPGHRKIKDEPDVSITRVKEEVKSGTMPGEGYQISYEEIWESDEEADMQELSELFREGFISDLKHGTVLPHVLPLELQPQFVDLMHKDVQQGILDEEDEVKAEIELDIKDHILPEKGDDQEIGDRESPTDKRSRKAGRILKSLDKETRENDLFMIQLPSILKVISQEAPSEDKLIFPSEKTNGDTKFIPTNGANASEKPTVEQLKLPAGRKIGKLVVTRGGRVYLRAGGHVMDVAHTASENQHQSVIMIETARDVHALQNGCGRFGDSAMYRDGSNAVYYLGQVRHHLTASLDWKQLRPIGMEKPASAPSEAMVSPSRTAKPVDLERMQRELTEIQKQRVADMTAALKRWNISQP